VFQGGIDLVLEILELEDVLVKHGLDVGGFDDTDLVKDRPVT
jgi:hypothetical protein